MRLLKAWELFGVERSAEEIADILVNEDISKILIDRARAGYKNAYFTTGEYLTILDDLDMKHPELQDPDFCIEVTELIVEKLVKNSYKVFVETFHLDKNDDFDFESEPRSSLEIKEYDYMNPELDMIGLSFQTAFKVDWEMTDDQVAFFKNEQEKEK